MPDKIIIHSLNASDLRRIETIQAEVPGWSDARQYAFFKELLQARPGIHSLIMFGVYYGRDLAFVVDILTRYHPTRSFVLAGVDKFTNTECADWPKEAKGKSWKDAGFGRPPSQVGAEKTLARMAVGSQITIEIIKADSIYHMKNSDEAYDVVYLDTSHDFETVTEEIANVLPVCSGPATIVCGDDYSDGGTWGVIKAVTAGFVRHQLAHGWVWWAYAGDRVQIRIRKGKR